MTLFIIRSAVTRFWRCANCNRTANSSVKPGMTYGGKCSGSLKGMHRWIMER